MLQKAIELIHSSINQRFYSYLAARVERPEFFTQQQLREEGYVSQFGQDKWVIESLLPNKQKGTFVDIGANDGIIFSNTYFLETMGWGGIAIEPIHSVYNELTKNRHCVTVNGCISPRSGKRLFRVVSGYPEMLSGLVEEYDPRHLNRISNEIETHGGKYEDIEVDCYNFNELLENNGISQVDYLSIDVEGAELNI
jgi:FkbM family methyltransferase